MNKIVTVTVTTPDGKEQGATSAIVETDRGAGFMRTDGRDVVTNRDKEVQFELAPGQRLVIEGWPQQEVVMDREQGAAVLRNNQGAIKVSDSAADGMSSSDLRKRADEMDNRTREQEAAAASAKADLDATHKKNLENLQKQQAQGYSSAPVANKEAAKNPATSTSPTGGQTAGKADAANPMKSSKDK